MNNARRHPRSMNTIYSTPTRNSSISSNIHVQTADTFQDYAQRENTMTPESSHLSPPPTRDPMETRTIESIHDLLESRLKASTNITLAVVHQYFNFHQDRSDQEFFKGLFAREFKTTNDKQEMDFTELWSQLESFILRDLKYAFKLHLLVQKCLIEVCQREKTHHEIISDGHFIVKNSASIVMKHLEPFTHLEKIKSVLHKADAFYDTLLDDLSPINLLANSPVLPNETTREPRVGNVNDIQFDELLMSPTQPKLRTNVNDTSSSILNSPSGSSDSTAQDTTSIIVLPTSAGHLATTYNTNHEEGKRSNHNSSERNNDTTSTSVNGNGLNEEREGKMTRMETGCDEEITVCNPSDVNSILPREQENSISTKIVLDISSVSASSEKTATEDKNQLNYSPSNYDEPIREKSTVSIPCTENQHLLIPSTFSSCATDTKNRETRISNQDETAATKNSRCSNLDPQNAMKHGKIVATCNSVRVTAIGKKSKAEVVEVVKQIDANLSHKRSDEANYIGAQEGSFDVQDEDSSSQEGAPGVQNDTARYEGDTSRIQDEDGRAQEGTVGAQNKDARVEEGTSGVQDNNAGTQERTSGHQNGSIRVQKSVIKVGIAVAQEGDPDIRPGNNVVHENQAGEAQAPGTTRRSIRKQKTPHWIKADEEARDREELKRHLKQNEDASKKERPKSTTRVRKSTTDSRRRSRSVKTKNTETEISVDNGADVNPEEPVATQSNDQTQTTGPSSESGKMSACSTSTTVTNEDPFILNINLYKTPAESNAEESSTGANETSSTNPTVKPKRKRAPRRKEPRSESVSATEKKARTEQVPSVDSEQSSTFSYEGRVEQPDRRNQMLQTHYSEPTPSIGFAETLALPGGPYLDNGLVNLNNTPSHYSIQQYNTEFPRAPFNTGYPFGFANNAEYPSEYRPDLYYPGNL